MSERPQEQEPSIEEILASIRQIISDDEEPQAAEPPDEKEEAPPAPPPPAPVATKPDKVNDVLELKNALPEEKKAAPPPPPPPPPEPVRREVVVEMREPVEQKDDSLLTPQAAGATLEGFARLANNMAVDRKGGLAAITLEDIVRDLMKPMLRDWLDTNLPPLIEKLVQKELDRIARKAMEE